MDYAEIAVLIPALKPDVKLLALTEQLRRLGLRNIVVVDDGSGSGYDEIFIEAEKQGCIVERYAENKGKGAALKIAVEKAALIFAGIKGYVTADADGQHLPTDIKRVAEELLSEPNCLVLGTRDFTQKNVPRKSFWGNRLTSFFFRVTNGISCPDTQTGLRGIPIRLTELALSEEGSRYEYEMNFLSDAAHIVPLKSIPIETVYENENKCSHFRPVADSLRVYGRPLRFAAASLTGAAADYVFFILLTASLSLPQTEEIWLATAAARVGSGIVNFLMNKHFSFKSRKPAGAELVRYFILFVAQMCASAAFVSLLSFAMPSVAAKIIVDTALFFFSYIIQKNWVFGRCNKGE